MKKRSAYLAIDFGTSNVHASVIDAETTRIIVNTNKKYGWYYPAQNQVELHIDETWKASEWAVGELIRQLPEGAGSKELNKTAAQIEEISKKIEVLGGKVELAMKKLAE